MKRPELMYYAKKVKIMLVPKYNNVKSICSTKILLQAPLYNII